jgi:hypothetical protein
MSQDKVTTVKDIIAYLHSQQEQKEEVMLKAVGLINEKDLAGSLNKIMELFSGVLSTQERKWYEGIEQKVVFHDFESFKHMDANVSILLELY